MPEGGDKRNRGPRCTAMTKRGERCQALAGTDGLCAAHRDPARMVELGRRGGAVGKGNARIRKQTPASLRAMLRERLDPELVLAAVQQALAGSSEAARVSAVKLLADLETYSQGSREQWEREMRGQIEAAAREFDEEIGARWERARDIRRQELTRLLEPIGMSEFADEEEELELVRALADRLAAIPEHVRAEF
jgi:hypothetical protein